MTAALLILAIACVAGLAFEFLAAPVGYQDHHGFHCGEPGGE
jgi:hypothetical protein